MINTYRYGGQGKDGKESIVPISSPVILNQMGVAILRRQENSVIAEVM